MGVSGRRRTGRGESRDGRGAEPQSATGKHPGGAKAGRQVRERACSSTWGDHVSHPGAVGNGSPGLDRDGAFGVRRGRTDAVSNECRRAAAAPVPLRAAVVEAAAVRRESARHVPAAGPDGRADAPARDRAEPDADRVIVRHAGRDVSLDDQLNYAS